MGRVVAFDYGTKRIGIAETDDLQLIASGLTTVQSDQIFDFLDKYLTENKVELFLVGEPRQMNNTPSESEVYIQTFLKHLNQKYPSIPIERIDERFTSKMAVKAMIDGGLSKKKRQDKALIDQISATIILQDYLEKKRK
ncbi:Holliday junction resolvase RuvX [Namhaeicola litoreus]|uniref:Putative pre-16S rRNA nuclease n=1 Tax=Namhaeicola litoreus TaxID=1052145 RepID=A0ABW3Y1M0_9FLAO